MLFIKLLTNFTWTSWLYFIFFLANSNFILQMAQAKTFKMRYNRCQYNNYIQVYSWNARKKAFHGFTRFANFVNFKKPMKSYFPAFLWISIDQITVPASSLAHFKGLGMRNLQYEKIICQKINSKVTIIMPTNLDYFQFCQFS